VLEAMLEVDGDKVRMAELGVVETKIELEVVEAAVEMDELFTASGCRIAPTKFVPAEPML
jgi:hypothetical protein